MFAVRRLALAVFVIMSLAGCVTVAPEPGTNVPGGHTPSVTPRPGSGSPAPASVRPMPAWTPPSATLAPYQPVASAEPVQPPIDQFNGPIQGVERYGSPEWVRAGVRMTFYGAAASVSQSGYTYVEDPEGPWEDPQTHKRYRRTDQGDEPEDMPSAAGQAYTQTDVIAVEPGNVVLATTMYPIDLMTNGLGINPLGGYCGQGAVVDGAWVHPTLMQDLQTSGYADQMILRGPYTLNGTVYDSVSFLYRGAGSWQDSTYDAATGALLATNTRVEGNPSPVHGPFDEPQGNVQLSYTRLVSVRELAIAGIGAAVPAWVTPGSTLQYTGSVVVVNPMDPSAQFSWPTSSSVTFGEVGATWATFSGHSVVDYGQYQQPSDTTGTTGPTGAYWYDPASLATMQVGQDLDQDPVTGAVLTVVSADGGVVTLLTQLNGASLSMSYDTSSGVLVGMDTTNSTTGITLHLQLVAG